jgi:hypothetical protein
LAGNLDEGARTYQEIYNEMKEILKSECGSPDRLSRKPVVSGISSCGIKTFIRADSQTGKKLHD